MRETLTKNWTRITALVCVLGAALIAGLHKDIPVVVVTLAAAAFGWAAIREAEASNGD
jgi:hypothetical protein